MLKKSVKPLYSMYNPFLGVVKPKEYFLKKKKKNLFVTLEWNFGDRVLQGCIKSLFPFFSSHIYIHHDKKK